MYVYHVTFLHHFYQSNKGRSPSNGELSDFSFYIDSQKSAHRKFKKIDQLII